jgi:PAS domain S-box-containing protein
MEQKNGNSERVETQAATGPALVSLPGTETPLAAVLEAALDAIVTLDNQGKVVHLNPAATRLFGHSLPDARGLDITDLIASPIEYGAGDPEFQHYFTKTKGPVLAQRLEMLALHANGARVPVELTLVRLATQEPLSYTAYIRDLSEQKRALAAVRESEERYRDLVENASDIIYTHDLSGRLTSWNSAGERITGYKLDETLGMNIAELVVPDHLERARSMIARKIVEGGRTAYELDILTKDGRRRTVEISSRLARQPGKAPHVQGMARDVTERKLALQALKEADRKKDEFLAMLAHELRNPLAPIRNALEILAMADDNPVAVKEMREMMERQVQQLVRLVDDLFDVSRITRGTFELRQERIDLAAVVATALETSRPLIEARKHRLVVDVPSEPLFVHGDITRLAQVVSNLLNNSARYTSEGGEIRLVVERRDDQAVIRVHDSGIGIPSDMLAHVFDMFTQLSGSTQNSQGGLGIGLTLVRNLVEMHGGVVVAHSEGAGKGSEFVVQLPLLESQPAAPHSNGSTEVVTPGTSASHRVLVVDDNIDAAESLGRMLRLMGNQVRTAHDGPSALEAAAAFIPDLVLLDIGLPGMDGHEVARRLRLLSGLQNAVLVAQTGWGQDEDRKRSREAGFNHHLVKPVSVAALQEVLSELPAGADSSS